MHTVHQTNNTKHDIGMLFFRLTLFVLVQSISNGLFLTPTLRQGTNVATLADVDASTLSSTRRNVLSWVVRSTCVLTSLPCEAVDIPKSALSTEEILDFVRGVPTFAIVDKKGVPFMVVGEDAKVTGYFFTTYTEATRLLQLAKRSADKSIADEKRQRREAEPNPWKEARISTVPLDSALTLVTTLSSKSKGGGNYFRLAPAEADVVDALSVTSKEDLAEGKVPLFYYADFTVEKGASQKSPLYFRKSELEDAFRGANPKTDLPPTLVTELSSLLTEMATPGANEEDLKSLFLVPPKESEKRRIECEKSGKNEPPFVVGQRILVL